MPIKLYVNTAADSPGQAAVRSELVPTGVRVPDVVRGDVNDYALYFVDGLGAFDTTFTADVYSITMAVGPIGGPLLATGSTWATTTSGFTGAMTFSGTSLATALGTASYLDSFVSVQTMSNATSHAHTSLLTALRILNKVNA